MGRQVDVFLEQLDIHCHENEWFVSMDTALEGITASEASWKAEETSNSIWQIVNHILFWDEDAVHRIRGTVNPKKAENNEVTFGEPGNPKDEEGWTQTVSRLKTVMADMKLAIAELSDETLNAPYRPNSSSIRRLVGNIMMHNTYHIGQIVLLRKLQKTWPAFDWS